MFSKLRQEISRKARRPLAKPKRGHTQEMPAPLYYVTMDAPNLCASV